MNFLTGLKALYSLVSVLGPSVPSVVEAVPTIAADAKKVVADLEKHDVTSTLSDVEATLAAVPAGAVEQVIAAAKGAFAA